MELLQELVQRGVHPTLCADSALLAPLLEDAEFAAIARALRRLGQGQGR